MSVAAGNFNCHHFIFDLNKQIRIFRENPPHLYASFMQLKDQF